MSGLTYAEEGSRIEAELTEILDDKRNQLKILMAAMVCGDGLLIKFVSGVLAVRGIEQMVADGRGGEIVERPNQQD
jgi:hypothetical protein